MENIGLSLDEIVKVIEGKAVLSGILKGLKLFIEEEMALGRMPKQAIMLYKEKKAIFDKKHKSHLNDIDSE